MRRYFTDAIPKGKEYDYSLPAVQGVQFCSKLFDCERYSKAKNHTAEQRKQFRLEKEKPILEAFWNWLDQQRPNKGTRLAKAVNYAQNRKDTLMTYLEDGHCSLSNNLSDNAIRPFTVGRKNWLFSASPKGAASSAIVYTMVEMAKANDLNTYKYLAYLLSQRPDEYYGLGRAASPVWREPPVRTNGATPFCLVSYFAIAGSNPYTSLIERSLDGSTLSISIL